MKKTMKMLLAAAMSAAVLSGCGAANAGAAASSAGETTAAVSETAAESQSEAASEANTQEAKETEKSSEPAVSAENDSDGTVIRVGGLKGPTTMGLVKLMDDVANDVISTDYEFTMVTAADELTALVAGGKVDIALLPANVASVLYNKTEGGVTAVDINTLGALYLGSADTSLTSIDQLKGRTVYLPGKGTTPEFALRYLISEAGLADGDVTLEFKSEATEVASVLAEDPQAIGLLPQPFVTSALAQNDSLSIVMDLTEVWDSVQTEESPSRLVTGVTIVNTGFLTENPELVDEFIAHHEASTGFTAEDPDTAAQLIADAGIVPKAPLAKQALPYCNITCIAGEEMKEALSGYLTVLYEQNPASVGGALPNEDFYYAP